LSSFANRQISVRSRHQARDISEVYDRVVTAEGAR